MIIHNMPQGSDEWFKVKCGKVSSRGYSKLLMGRNTKGRMEYLYKIADERKYGKPCPDNFSNYWTERGLELEPIARTAYEIETMQDVRVVGFVELDDKTGSSPDGLVKSDGILELKCLKYENHVAILMSNEVPKDHWQQCQYHLFCNPNRRWCDFGSFHPEHEMDIKIIRVLPDTSFQNSIKENLTAFNKEVDELLAKPDLNGQLQESIKQEKQ